MDAVTILEDAGFRVLDIATSDEAVALLRQYGREFALLFTAAGLDGQHDGFALARLAASDYPNISIIVASGHHTSVPHDQPGSACFIQKPLSAKVIHQHLRRIVPDDKKSASLK